MSDYDLLGIPRGQAAGRLLHACRALPLAGSFCELQQRRLRKRFLSGLTGVNQQAQVEKLSRGEPGAGLQSALQEWLKLPAPAAAMEPEVPPHLPPPSCRCSVIINTVDRAGELAITLADLRANWDAAQDELIVVVGPGSADSLAVLEEPPLPLRIIHCPEKNLSVSRNLGWRTAKGRFVAFLDDDASPMPGWLTALLAPLEDGAGIAAGYVMNGDGTRLLNRHVVADKLGRAWDTPDAAAAMEKTAALGRQRSFLTATGCNMAMRREVLAAMHGFDGYYRYFLEETDLVCRAADSGMPCAVAPDSRVRHRLGPNVARTPSFALEDRMALVRSQLHFIDKFARPAYAPGEIAAAVWGRLLRDLEKIAWDHACAGSHKVACIAGQKAYLTALQEHLRHAVAARIPRG